MSRANRTTFGAVVLATLLMLGNSHAATDDEQRAPAEFSFFGGGWDLNGPSISGTQTLGADESTRPQPQRGGWDGNGPSNSGSNVSSGAELDLDHLVVEAVILPGN